MGSGLPVLGITLRVSGATCINIDAEVDWEVKQRLQAQYWPRSHRMHFHLNAISLSASLYPYLP